MVGWARDELERIGRDPATFSILHYSILLPGRSEAEALAGHADALWAMSWKYSDMEASARRPGPPPSPPPTPAAEELVKGRAVFAGPPESIVESLQAIRERARMPVEFVARSYFPLLGWDAQVEVMQSLAEGVAPHV